MRNALRRTKDEFISTALSVDARLAPLKKPCDCVDGQFCFRMNRAHNSWGDDQSALRFLGASAKLVDHAAQ